MGTIISMSEIQMELDVLFIAWLPHGFIQSSMWYVFSISIVSAIKGHIYMSINVFNNKRMKRGRTCHLSTDLVQSCSPADVTWAWLGGSSSSLSMWKYSNSRSWSDARNQRQPIANHLSLTRFKMCLSFCFSVSFAFRLVEDGCVWTQTRCAFLRLVSKPKLFTVLSKLERGNKAEQTGFSQHASVTRIINGRSTHQLQLILSFIQRCADQRHCEASSQIIWREALKRCSLSSIFQLLLHWSVVIRAMKNCGRNASFAVTSAFIHPFVIHKKIN